MYWGHGKGGLLYGILWACTDLILKMWNTGELGFRLVFQTRLGIKRETYKDWSIIGFVLQY